MVLVDNIIAIFSNPSDVTKNRWLILPAKKGLQYQRTLTLVLKVKSEK